MCNGNLLESTLHGLKTIKLGDITRANDLSEGEPECIGNECTTFHGRYCRETNDLFENLQLRCRKTEAMPTNTKSDCVLPDLKSL